MTVKINIGKYVEIIWNDASTSHGWSNNADNETYHQIRSVGWIIKDTPEQVTIASDISDGSPDPDSVGVIEHNRRLNIPKDWIKKIRKRSFGV